MKVSYILTCFTLLFFTCINLQAGEKRLKIEDAAAPDQIAPENTTQPGENLPQEPFPLLDLPPEVIENVIANAADIDSVQKLLQTNTYFHSYYMTDPINFSWLIKSLAQRFNMNPIAVILQFNLEKSLLMANNEIFSSLIEHLAEQCNVCQPFISFLFSTAISEQWINDTKFPYRMLLIECAYFEMLEFIAEYGQESLPMHMKNKLLTYGRTHQFLNNRQSCFNLGNQTFLALYSPAQLIMLKSDGSLDTSFANDGFFKAPDDFTIDQFLYLTLTDKIAILISKYDRETDTDIKDILLINKPDGKSIISMREDLAVLLNEKPDLLEQINNTIFLFSSYQGFLSLITNINNVYYIFTIKKDEFIGWQLPEFFNERIYRIIAVSAINKNTILMYGFTRKDHDILLQADDDNNHENEIISSLILLRRRNDSNLEPIFLDTAEDEAGSSFYLNENGQIFLEITVHNNVLQAYTHPLLFPPVPAPVAPQALPAVDAQLAAGVDDLQDEAPAEQPEAPNE